MSELTSIIDSLKNSIQNLADAVQSILQGNQHRDARIRDLEQRVYELEKSR